MGVEDFDVLRIVRCKDGLVIEDAFSTNHALIWGICNCSVQVSIAVWCIGMLET